MASNTCASDGLIGCDDANICTDDLCNETTDSCQNIPDSGNDPSCTNPCTLDSDCDDADICTDNVCNT